MANDSKLSIVVLAAGKGQRMKSKLPKVCHEIGNAPLIWHVLSTSHALKAEQIIAVISPDTPAVENAIKDFSSFTKKKITVAYQMTQEGTGHAVLSALPSLDNTTSDILVLYGDTPLLTAKTITKLIEKKTETNASVVVLGMRPQDPGKYGRVFVDSKGQIERIVEYTNASKEELKNTLCNSGVMLISGSSYQMLLEKLTKENKQGEYLLTDIVEHAQKQGLITQCVEGNTQELQGVNNREDLALCEAAIQTRWRSEAMTNGATLIDPQTVYFSYDTQLGQDVIIHPNVYFGPGVKIGDNTKVLSFSHIEGADIAMSSSIGPFARIRPGTVLESNTRIGNFVEIKKSHIKRKAKVNHLSYIGDATVGEEANIGAGTITCNYDGYNKNETIIGNNTFIGSNTALVAPVEIGDRSIIAAGSVITKNVGRDSIAMTRSEQIENTGAALRYREKRSDIENKG